MAARPKGTTRAQGRPGPAKPKPPAARKPPAAPKPPAAEPQPPKTPQAATPAALRLAAAAQVIEAAGLCVAAAFGAISTADGKSSQAASGAALSVFALLVAVGVALIAAALAKARPWSRTPTVMTQLFVVIGGIVLLDGNRPEWGVPALALAAACLAGVLTPASLRALNRPPANTQ